MYYAFRIVNNTNMLYYAAPRGIFVQNLGDISSGFICEIQTLAFRLDNTFTIHLGSRMLFEAPKYLWATAL